MKLEDQLKNTFDRFEPEVDPSVWAKVSGQLTSPSAIPESGSSGSSGIIKIIASKLAPFAGWIAGATAIIGLGIILKMNSKEENSTEKTPINIPNIKAQEILNEEKSISNPSSSTLKKSATITNSTTEKVRGTSIVAKRQQTFISGHFNNGLNISENVNSDNVSNKNNSENPGSITSTTNSNSTASNKAIDPISDVEIAQNSVNQIPAKEEKIAEPVILLNTRGGFAPLSVIAFTNQNGIKADFNFGDGTQINSVTNASHRFNEPGIYTVKCLVSGRELETTVEVLGQLPSVFSPNGDGINDLFTIGGNEVSTVDVHIYDRTGRMMLTGKGKQVIWDGTISGGQIAETGTYFYDIFATSISGVTYKQKGTINLFK